MSTTMHMDRADKNKVGTAEIEDLRVIPVIFLPGIMGTNLKVKPKDDGEDSIAVWRYDSKTSLLGWTLPSSGPKERKRLLHPDRVKIDNRGLIPMSPDVQKHIDLVIATQYPSNIADKEEMERFTKALLKAEEEDHPEKKLFGSRRDRGWGEVAAPSYGAFLDALQTALYRDKPTKKDNTLSAIYQKLVDEPLGLEFGVDSLDETYLEVMKLYQFPVHVVGYNWLGSNILSAKRLGEEVDRIIDKYQTQGMKCSKVILVTHSMGGLVARYYSECLEGRDKIYGIVHGVMPSVGAAATYTRMKRGTENTESGLAGAVGYLTSHILGRNAAEMVAIGSQSSGALELLPANNYGDDWLKVVDRDGSILTLPADLPVGEDGKKENCLYSGLYLNRDKWWKLMDENLLNPFNTTLNKRQIDSDWLEYENLIKDNVKPFQEQLADKYHPYTYSFYGKAKGGELSAAYRTQETAVWSGALASGQIGETPPAPKMNDERLYLSEVSADRTVKDELSPEEQAWAFKGDNNVVYGWVGQRFTLRDACENGDGTVPLRAGQIVHENIRERLAVQVLHEAAYRDTLSQAFTLRSIIKIAQQVNYDEKMVFA